MCISTVYIYIYISNRKALRLSTNLRMWPLQLKNEAYVLKLSYKTKQKIIILFCNFNVSSDFRSRYSLRVSRASADHNFLVRNLYKLLILSQLPEQHSWAAGTCCCAYFNYLVRKLWIAFPLAVRKVRDRPSAFAKVDYRIYLISLSYGWVYFYELSRSDTTGLLKIFLNPISNRGRILNTGLAMKGELERQTQMTLAHSCM